MPGIWSTLLSILEFLLAFGALVFLHEFGHFIFARLNKIEVEEFGFGMRPRMLKLFTFRGTLFSLNWIPFGGFCQMKGQDGDVNEPGSFMAAKAWRRLVTLLGGPITNLLIGMMIIAFLFTRTGAPDYRQVEIVAIAQNSPAAQVNLQNGDLIKEINGVSIDSMNKLSQMVSPNLGKPIELLIQRQDNPILLTIIPRVDWPSNEGPLGITIANPVIKLNFIQSIPMAAQTTLDQGVQLILLPVKLISGQIAPSDARMVSVKGIYDIFAQVQTIDKEESAIDPSVKGLNTLWFLAIISIALGFTNLLPIPALDGGRIIFLIPELLFRKKVSPALEGKIHMVGYVILMALMVMLLVNDILHPIVLP
jgi:regulator of sigma E protease